MKQLNLLVVTLLAVSPVGLHAECDAACKDMVKKIVRNELRRSGVSRCDDCRGAEETAPDATKCACNRPKPAGSQNVEIRCACQNKPQNKSCSSCGKCSSCSSCSSCNSCSSCRSAESDVTKCACNKPQTKSCSSCGNSTCSSCGKCSSCNRSAEATDATKCACQNKPQTPPQQDAVRTADAAADTKCCGKPQNKSCSSCGKCSSCSTCSSCNSCSSCK